MLNSARSRKLPAISRRTRMDQTCRGRSGRFWPTIRPLFQGARTGRRIGRKSTGMGLPPVHRPHPSSVMPTTRLYHVSGQDGHRRPECARMQVRTPARDKWPTRSVMPMRIAPTVACVGAKSPWRTVKLGAATQAVRLCSGKPRQSHHSTSSSTAPHHLRKRLSIQSHGSIFCR